MEKSMSLRNSLTICLLLLPFLVSCGGGSSASIDSGESPDPAVNKILSVTPANNSNKVSILSDIRIEFEYVLSQQDFDNLDITLKGYENSRFPAGYYTGEESFADSSNLLLNTVDLQLELSSNNKIITLTPRRPLLYATRYLLTINSESFTFLTFKNKIKSSVTYSGFGDNEIDNYRIYSPTEYKIEYQTYYNSGADRQWQTNDDVATELFTQQLDSENRVIRENLYQNIDGNFEQATALRSYNKFDYNAEGQLVRNIFFERDSNDPYYLGDDGTFGTEDDIPKHYFHFEKVGESELYISKISNSGDDQTLYTNDDLRSELMIKKFNTDGFLTHQYQFGTNTPLNDSSLEEAHIQSGYAVEYEELKPVSAKQIIGAGNDMTFFTADDDFTRMLFWDFAGTNHVQTFRYIDNAGEDGLWNTNDDTLRTLKTYEYDSNGLLTNYKRIHTQSTEQQATIIIEHIFEYDEQGNRQNYTIYLVKWPQMDIQDPLPLQSSVFDTTL